MVIGLGIRRKIIRCPIFATINHAAFIHARATVAARPIVTMSRIIVEIYRQY